MFPQKQKVRSYFRNLVYKVKMINSRNHLKAPAGRYLSQTAEIDKKLKSCYVENSSPSHNRI